MSAIRCLPNWNASSIDTARRKTKLDRAVAGSAVDGGWARWSESPSRLRPTALFGSPFFIRRTQADAIASEKGGIAHAEEANETARDQGNARSFFVRSAAAAFFRSPIIVVVPLFLSSNSPPSHQTARGPTSSSRPRTTPPSRSMWDTSTRRAFSLARRRRSRSPAMSVLGAPPTPPSTCSGRYAQRGLRR